MPEHRRKRIYTGHFYALPDKAKKQGNIFSILSGTHPNNLAAQAAFEAQGRTKEYIMYSYPLKDRGDGKEPTESAVAQSQGRSFEEMRMPEYLVEPFDTAPDGLKSMQAFINEKACAPPGSAGKHMPVGTDLFLAQLRAKTSHMSEKAEVLLDGS
ncbi:hypothetical protein [Sinorhizobium meliloti]|uniref:hypothetical protein n=1 Tax=Rhizobium meliloti TaxID=382 RepID=UPI001F381ED5|nr:hypothetical protein [Sinorhizobium meliloti]